MLDLGNNKYCASQIPLYPSDKPYFFDRVGTYELRILEREKVWNFFIAGDWKLKDTQRKYGFP